VNAVLLLRDIVMRLPELIFTNYSA